MRVFSHPRLPCKNGANIQMGSVNYVNAAERWASIYWGEDPLGSPPDIFRSACVASELQRLQGLTIRVFSGCKTT